MKTRVLWVLLFLFFMGVGFLHGYLPEGLPRAYVSTPESLRILITDGILFPPALRDEVEKNLNVKLSVIERRDWEAMLPLLIARPGMDLLLLPSFWANTLNTQGLTQDVRRLRPGVSARVASDFLGSAAQGGPLHFFPLFWMKTAFQTSGDKDFSSFLEDPELRFLFMLLDEDLMLHHLRSWKAAGLADKIARKRIMTLQLDHLLTPGGLSGAAELPVIADRDLGALSALLIWGGVIPLNSLKPTKALEILEYLSRAAVQERFLLQTPFNTPFTDVVSTEIPLHRRAAHIRDLQLRDTLILESKDQNAKEKLRTEFEIQL